MLLIKDGSRRIPMRINSRFSREKDMKENMTLHKMLTDLPILERAKSNEIAKKQRKASFL